MSDMPHIASRITVRAVDYADARDSAALVALLDAYASDPAGGGEPLTDAVKAQLAPALGQCPGAFSVIAWAQGPQGGEQAVGLVNCFEGFSTFACRPLVNVHDVAVLPAWRGQRVVQQMLAEVEAMARARGACKLTLEVLSGNAPARRAYERQGFADYALDPAWGQAQFMQKKL